MTTTERPMVFSAPMVQAFVAGRKTQTRQLAEPRWQTSLLPLDPDNAEWIARAAPFHVGHRMWVKEAYRFQKRYDDLVPAQVPDIASVYYEAAGPYPGVALGRLRSTTYMPRWARRIERMIVNVRLVLLNDCTEEDALAEGVIWSDEWQGFIFPGVDHPNPDFPVLSRPTAREMYAALWDVINGSGAWLGNPRVWVIEFSPS